MFDATIGNYRDTTAFQCFGTLINRIKLRNTNTGNDTCCTDRARTNTYFNSICTCIGKGNGSIGSGPNDTVAADGISATNGSVLNVGARSAADANGGAMAAAVWPGPGSGGPTPPHLPPSMAKLAAPKVVGGSTPPRAAVRALPEGEHPPFDPDGT